MRVQFDIRRERRGRRCVEHPDSSTDDGAYLGSLRFHDRDDGPHGDRYLSSSFSSSFLSFFSKRIRTYIYIYIQVHIFLC